MGKKQGQLTLSNDDQARLNGIIEKMKANKESDVRIRLVTQDFTNKYGVEKKKDLSSPGSQNTASVSGKPSATSQSIESSQLVNTDPNLIPSVETVVPTPLSPQGQQDYLNDQLSPSIDTTFNAGLGNNQASNPLGPSNPILTNAQGIGGKEILDSAPEPQQGNYGSYTWNQLLKGIGSLSAGTIDAGAQALPEAINFTPSGVMAQIGEKVFGMENPYKRNDAAIEEFRANDASKVRNYFVDNLGANIDPETEARYNEGIISGGIGGLVNSLPAIAGTAITGNLSPFFIQGYDSAIQSLDGKEVDDETKTIYATGLGYVNAKLEKIGFDKIFPGAANGIAKSILNKSIKEATEQTAGKVTGNVLDKYIDENLKGVSQRFAKFGSKGLQGFLAEYGTGSAQEVSTIGSEYLLNASTGKPVFDTEDMSTWEGFIDNVSRVNTAGLMEGVGGGILGSASAVLSPTRKKTVSDTKRQLDIVNEQLNNEDLNERAKEILLQRKLKLEDSLAQEIALDGNETAGLAKEQREQAELLSSKIDDIEQVLNDTEVDEATKAVIQQEFDAAVNELNEIVSSKPEENAVTEPTSDGNDTNVVLIKPNDVVNYIDDTGNVIEVPVESVDGDTATIGINNNGIYESRQVPLSSLSQTESQQGVIDTTTEAQATEVQDVAQQQENISTTTNEEVADTVKPKAQTKKNRTDKALSNDPRSFREAINQFFLGKGALSTEDFIRLTGFGYTTNKDGKQVMSPELRKAKFLGLVKDRANGGMDADMILMNHVPEAFQNDGGMDLISEIADLAANGTKGRMLAEIEAMENEGQVISEEQIAELQKEEAVQQELNKALSESDLSLLDDDNERAYYEELEEHLNNITLTEQELASIDEVLAKYTGEDGEVNWEQFENDFVDLQNDGFNELLSLEPSTLDKIFNYGTATPKRQIEERGKSKSSSNQTQSDSSTEQSKEPTGGTGNTASEQARQAVDKQLADLDKAIDQQKKKIQSKLDSLSSRNDLFAAEGVEDGNKQQQLFNEATNTDQSNIDSVIAPLQAELEKLQDQRNELEANKEAIVSDAANQQELIYNQTPNQDAQVMASYIMPIKPFTDLIKKAVGEVNKFQERFIARNYRKVEDYIANNLNNWLSSKSGAKRISAQLLTSIMNGLPRSQENLKAKLGLIGGMNKAAYDARKMMENLYAIVDNDNDKLERVHQVLDPEFYLDQGISPLDYNSLGQDEQMLYDQVRDILDKVHQRNFALGFITRETYDKFKGKYMPRLYEVNEIPDEVQQLLDEQTKYNPVNKLDLGQYKARKDVSELSQKALDNLLKDPVYAAAKRTMQMQQNAAINNYINRIIADTPHLVKNPKKDDIPNGYQLMSGKGYGAFDGKYVPNYIAEDLKGFKMLNETLQKGYEAFKAYDRFGFRQFLKKSYTVFNPVVQLGNFISNFTFAFSAGIDPVTFAGNMPKAYKALSSENADYQTLLKEGILGSDIVTADLIPAKAKSNTAPADKNMLIKAWEAFDEKAMKLYGMSDEIAKMNAFITFKEQGLSEAEAIQKVYEGFQNYATVGKMWDVTSKTPLIGNPFIKFQADLFRIMKNGATKTPLTTSMYLASLYFMPQILTAFGIGDKEEDDKEFELRTGRSFIPKVPLGFMDIPLVYKTKFGEVNLARYLSPFYLFDTGSGADMANLLEKIAPIDMIEKEQVGKGNKSYQMYLSDPVLGTLTSALFTDTDFRGKSIQDPEASRYRASGATSTEKLLNKLTFLGRSWIPQGAQMHDFYLSQKYGEDFYGRTRDLGQSMLNMVVKVQDWQDSDYKKEAQKRLDVNLSKIKTLTDEQKNIVKTNVKHREDAYQDYSDKKITPNQLERRLTKFDDQLDKRLRANVESYEEVIKDINKFIDDYRDFLK